MVEYKQEIAAPPNAAVSVAPVGVPAPARAFCFRSFRRASLYRAQLSEKRRDVDQIYRAGHHMRNATIATAAPQKYCDRPVALLAAPIFKNGAFVSLFTVFIFLSSFHLICGNLLTIKCGFVIIDFDKCRFLMPLYA